MDKNRGVGGDTKSVAEVRAAVEAGKRQAAIGFEKMYGVPLTRENVELVARTCIANAHLFKPRGGRS